MARKQQGSDLLTLVVIGVMCAAPFVLAALVLLLRTSVLILLSAFPLLVLAAYFASCKSAMPAAPEIPNETQNREELELKKQHASVDLTYYSRLVQGEQEGFTLTRASDETRFDRRFPRARQLNQQLDQLEARRADLQYRISDFTASRGHNLAIFKAELRQWRSKASLRVCANVAALGTAGALLVLLVAQFANASVLSALDHFLIWSKSPADLVLPFKAAMLGYLAALIAYPVARIVLRRRTDLAVRNHEQSLPSNDLPEDYQPEIERFDGDQDEQEDETFEEPAEEGEEYDFEEWHQVLNVDPDATVAEIKSAYRQQLKQNHPDNVATLGIKIREAAEAESKRINNAYAEARSQRGF